MNMTRFIRWILATLIFASTVYNFFLATTTRRQHQHQRQQQLQDNQSVLLQEVEDPVLHLKQQQQRTTVHNNNNNHNTIAPPIRFQKSLNTQNASDSNKDDNDNDKVCLSSACLLQQGRRLARVFPNRPKKTWCIPSSQEKNHHRQIHRRGSNSMNDNGDWQGLLLVKVPKAASSTSAGVVLRIANQTSDYDNDDSSSSCHTTAVQWQHVPGMEYANRTKSQSFLIAPIRNPALRAFSSTWFFILAPLNVTDSDENVIRALNTNRGGGKTKGKGGYQFNYLSLEPIPPKSFWLPEKPTHVMNASLVHEKVLSIIQGYDFFMVVERMDESLTALALLTGLNLGSVITPSSSKVAGDYRIQRIGRKKGKCHYQRKGIMSNGVQDYFNSQEWLAMNYADEILYRAANASLDLTIDSLGRNRFDLAVTEYRRLQKKASLYCERQRQGQGQGSSSECTAHGELIEATEQEECYDRDFGCGYKCLDDFLIQERKLMNHIEIAPGVRI